MIWICVAILIIILLILCWCICATTPREPWEDEAEREYVDEWVRKKTM